MFFVNLPQNRHPERSASQIYRVTQRLLARSRRTPAVLILPMLFGAFQPRSPHLEDPPQPFPGAENKNSWHLVTSGSYIYILGSHTGTLCIGVTSNLYPRVMHLFSGFGG